MSTAVQNANAARKITNGNVTFCQAVTAINWLSPVIVKPDEKRNPDGKPEGLWVITASSEMLGKRFLVARGTQSYCTKVHRDLVNAVAYDHEAQPLLTSQIEQLLLEAKETNQKLQDEGKTLFWRDQTRLVTEVYFKTSQAAVLVGLYKGDLKFPSVKFQDRISDIRRRADFTIFGYKVWSIQIMVDEVFVSQIKDLSSDNLVIQPFEFKKNEKTPKFVTHQLVARDSGKILVRGSLEGCRAFYANCYCYFTELRAEQAKKAAQQKFEQEKIAKKTEISQELPKFAKRLRDSEGYGEVNKPGSVASDLAWCIQEAGKYRLDFANEFRAIFDLALSIL